tara:strand:- start:3868 stop:5001 length:1134 start_codon:yes stop_codon:yes gene_type:complete
MSKWKLPLFKMYQDETDVESVSSVIKRGSFWAGGPEIGEYEQNLKGYLEQEYVLSFSSGTTALHALLHAYGVEGKEVIVPSFTFIATVNSIVIAGGVPVFADIEKESLGLDVQDVESKITNETRAILIVHYGGMPACNTMALKKLAEQKGILFIEDAAEAMGAEIDGQKVGSIGDGCIMSTCQNKIISTGEGGLATTKDPEIYQKLKFLRSHGRVDNIDYFTSVEDNDYSEVGSNFRMASMNAALGISQLKKIGEIIEGRRKLAIRMDAFFAQYPKVRVLKASAGDYAVYQLYSIILESEELRDELQKFLEEKAIMTKVYFNPVHLKTLYQKKYSQDISLENTDDISRRVLTLPFFPQMDDSEFNYLTQSIHGYFTV